MNFRSFLRGLQSIAKADSPLYIQRRLTAECASRFVQWAKSQGFEKVLAPEELHATVVYSKQPVDWGALDVDDTPLVTADGQRKVEALGDKGAVVLKFKSDRLQARWAAWRACGASWDYEGYQPHVTITYNNPPDFDLKVVQPFPGTLEFEPELQEPINADYAEQVVEKFDFFKVFKSNPYHDEEGQFTSKEKDADGVSSSPKDVAWKTFEDKKNFVMSLVKEIGLDPKEISVVVSPKVIKSTLNGKECIILGGYSPADVHRGRKATLTLYPSEFSAEIVKETVKHEYDHHKYDHVYVDALIEVGAERKGYARLEKEMEKLGGVTPYSKAMWGLVAVAKDSYDARKARNDAIRETMAEMATLSEQEYAKAPEVLRAVHSRMTKLFASGNRKEGG